MSYLDTILRDSPYLCWPFDDNAASTAVRDVSGNSRAGVTSGDNTSLYTSTPGLVPGTTRCFDLDGSNDRLQRATEAGFDVGTGDFTFEWLMQYGSTPGTFYCIATIEQGGSGAGRIFYLNSAGRPRVYVASTMREVAGTNLLDGTLRHMVWTRVSGTNNVYSNGVLDDTWTAAGNSNRANNLMTWGRTDDDFYPFPGKLAYATYYTTGFTAGQATTHYQAMLRNGVSY